MHTSCLPCPPLRVSPSPAHPVLAWGLLCRLAHKGGQWHFQSFNPKVRSPAERNEMHCNTHCLCRSDRSRGREKYTDMGYPQNTSHFTRKVPKPVNSSIWMHFSSRISHSTLSFYWCVSFIDNLDILILQYFFFQLLILHLLKKKKWNTHNLTSSMINSFFSSPACLLLFIHLRTSCLQILF